MNPVGTVPEIRQRQSFFARLLAPKTWVILALSILAAFAVVHFLGWRDDTRFISGTTAPDFTLVRGMIYALAYFGAVLAAPILLLAAALQLAFRRIGHSKGSGLREI